MLTDLSLATLGNLDRGTVRVLVDKAIDEAVRDLDDRNTLEAAELDIPVFFGHP